MNFSTSVFVINSAARAIVCEYDPNTAKDKRVVYKTLDPAIKTGDLVIVPTETRHKFTVVKVIETDVPVNFDQPETMHWIVGKVDISIHTQLLADEAKAIKTLQVAEQRKRADEMRRLIVGDDVDLTSLPLYKNGDHAKPA